MMLTEDYLMRMINQAVAVLVKVMGLKKSGDYPQAQQAVDQALELLMGLPINIIKRMDDESLLKALTQQDHLDLARLALVADLFKEEGDILAAQDKISESRESYLRSLTYHLETGFAETAHSSSELTIEIEGLVQKIGAQNLPDDTLWDLFCYYEQSRAYGKADGVVLKMAERPHFYASIRPEVAAFYERLLKMPVRELVEGGVDRGQIERKLETAMKNRNDK